MWSALCWCLSFSEMKKCTVKHWHLYTFVLGLRSVGRILKTVVPGLNRDEVLDDTKRKKNCGMSAVIQCCNRSVCVPCRNRECWTEHLKPFPLNILLVLLMRYYSVKWVEPHCTNLSNSATLSAAHLRIFKTFLHSIFFHFTYFRPIQQSRLAFYLIKIF